MHRMLRNFGWNGSWRDPMTNPSTACTALLFPCIPLCPPSVIRIGFFHARLTQSLCWVVFSTVRGNRPGKPVQLAEYEIKYLCTKAREIFINQPILLELEAPIKICGGYWGLLNTFFVYSSFFSSSLHHYRRHPRTILRPVATLRIWRVPTRSQLPVPRRLRG